MAACYTGVVALLEDCILEVWSPGLGFRHPVAACGAGVVALLEDFILEAWSPGGPEPGDLEARMMRLRMRMLMNDGKDED